MLALLSLILPFPPDLAATPRVLSLRFLLLALIVLPAVIGEHCLHTQPPSLIL